MLREIKFFLKVFYLFTVHSLYVHSYQSFMIKRSHKFVEIKVLLNFVDGRIRS